MTLATVVGCGAMGPGIAATLARGGMTVRVHDVSAAALERGSVDVASADTILARLGVVQRGSPAPVTFHTDLEAACHDADLAIETVPENETLKAEVLRKIDRVVGTATVIASDTSGIPITRLQAHVSHPERFIGMHWSNPPHLIPVIEVIAGAQTAGSTVDWMLTTVRALGLLPVRVKKDVAGFVENRILYALLREAIDLVETGVIGPEDLDTCVSWGIGYKLAVIGPMALLDMAGLDIYQAVGSYLNPQLSARSDVSVLVAESVAAGRLGLKSGRGLYEYSPGRVAALAAARATKLIAVRHALEAADDARDGI